MNFNEDLGENLVLRRKLCQEITLYVEVHFRWKKQAVQIFLRASVEWLHSKAFKIKPNNLDWVFLQVNA